MMFTMKRIKQTWAVSLLALLSLFASQPLLAEQPVNKPRVIVTCDPELDDLNSLIRLLLFSTDFRIEGLIYTSSQFHWKGDGKGTLWYVPGREYSRNGLDLGPMTSWRWAEGERFIDEAVDTYEQVYPNLKAHRSDYPTPQYLRSKIRFGNIEFDGEMSKDTPGSELIKQVLMEESTEPVFVMAWGGCSTIARALKSIETIYQSSADWPQLKERISKKTILCLSGDQDDTYARYIHPFWPGIEPMQIGNGLVNLAYSAQHFTAEANKVYFSPEWMREHISAKGPFGAMYRVWGDGKQMVKDDRFDFFGFDGLTADQLRAMGYVVWTNPMPKGSFLAEGDTFTYLNLLDNGLRAHEEPTYGGWSGRAVELPDSLKGKSMRETLAYQQQWVGIPDGTAAVMNGLSARLDWSMTADYTQANHEPQIEGPLAMTVKAGETVSLKYKVSDPDKDAVVCRWLTLPAGTYTGAVRVADPQKALTQVSIPQAMKAGETIHLLLEVVDKGSPALTRYHRVILTAR